jgi:hypothetical protein
MAKDSAAAPAIAKMCSPTCHRQAWVTAEAITVVDLRRDKAAPEKTAADYLDAQVEPVVMARLAQDADLAMTELHTSWLDTSPEGAVIEAQVRADQEAPAPPVNDAVSKILDSLRSTATNRPCAFEDVEVHGVE